MSERRLTFVEQVLAGEAVFDEIDDFVDAWHESDGDEDLASFLGFSLDEYSLWVAYPDAVGLIVSARVQGRSVMDAVNDNFDELKIAARAVETKKVAVLRAWLTKIGRID